eukprot:scaffold82221_cov66-Phaeocystis_antarctica.AAC.4
MPGHHRDPDVLCRDGRYKEGVKVAARARENCPAVHIAPRGIVGAVLNCECCHVLIVKAMSRTACLNSNAMDRHDAPGVDSHPLPGSV